MTAAVGANSYVSADFVTAIIAKKTWFLVHFYIIGIFLCGARRRNAFIRTIAARSGRNYRR